MSHLTQPVSPAQHIYETDEDFAHERQYLAEAFIPLVQKCKKVR